jgi:phosphate-selective porin OprO/OprP
MNIAMSVKTGPRSALRGLIVLAAAGMLWPALVAAQDAEERIRLLEEQLRTMTRELQTIKQELDAAKAAAPTQDAAEVQRTKAQAAGAAAAAGEAREKATALEQRLDTTGLFRPADGIGLQDTRGRWALRLNGRVQLDYRSFDEDIVSDTFSIRRARLGATVTYLQDYLFRVEGEYASGNASTGTHNTTATHVYLQLGWLRPWALIRLGQSKPQFGLENTESANFSDFQERGLTQSLIQNLNYDRGVMIDGTPFTGFNYGLSFTNGTGLNADERQGNAQDIDADGMMLTARATENFAELLGRPGMVLHLGANYKSGKATNSATSPFAAATGQTEARGVTFFTPQAFNSATGTASNVDRELWAYELALAYGPVKLQSEYWTANYQGTRQVPAPVTAFDLDIDSYYVNLMWMITGEAYGESYKDGQFGRIRPRNNFSWRDRTWGGWELGLRYSEFDASDFALSGSSQPGRLAATQTAPVTVGTNKAQAYTLGLKWLPNAYTRFMLNYVHTDFDTPIVAGDVTTDEEHAITLRGQIDF